MLRALFLFLYVMIPNADYLVFDTLEIGSLKVFVFNLFSLDLA